MLVISLLLLALFAVSTTFTGWLRRHALATLLIDVPNERSSHAVPTPRGGGLAIAVSTILALLALATLGWLSWPSVLGVCGAGTLVAIIGAVDDRHSVAARWRLLVHFCAAGWILVLINNGGLIRTSSLLISALVFALAALYLVWMLNLTNFMDGIDAMAAVETITVCVGAALLSVLVAPATRLWLSPAVLASATLGFLVWNWPPAKIFMGDVGSGFLGLTLAALSLQAGYVETKLFWSWIILLGVFIVDATVTLLRRLANGERLYEAHRTHAYQHAAARRGAHLPVTLAVGAINTAWLLPVALVVARGWVHGVVGVLVAYTPLILAAVKLQAGRRAHA